MKQNKIKQQKQKHDGKNQTQTRICRDSRASEKPGAPKGRGSMIIYDYVWTIYESYTDHV